MKQIILIACLLVSFPNMAQIELLYKRAADYQRFHGTVMVHQERGEGYLGTYGKADQGQDITPNTAFDIGSVSKQFTAAAILALVEQGKLGLHDPINQYLGKFARKHWRKVTVHQLLTHTSGIPSIYQTDQGVEIFMPEKDPIGIDQLIDRFDKGKLLFRPGKRFEYSNSGYVLLAAIIEHLSDMSYADYMNDSIFSRYGLENTSVGIVPGRESAMPYYGYRDGEVRRAPLSHYTWMIGAGGVYSTVADLQKWIGTIRSAGFLNEELRNAFLAGYVSFPGGYYGYGWVHTRDGLIEHEGANAGYVSFLSFDPVADRSVIILTNHTFEGKDRLGESSELIRHMMRDTWKILNETEVAPLPEKTRHEISNVTFVGRKDTFRIRSSGAQLIISGGNTRLSRIVGQTALSGASAKEQDLLAVARLIRDKKYWKMARYCNGEMSFVAYSGLLSIGFKMMRKRTGTPTEVVAFRSGENHGLLRMTGAKGSLDLIIYFDEQRKISGIFDRKFYAPATGNELSGYPIGENEVFIDGFPYGEESLTLKISDKTVILDQFGREVVLDRIE